MSELELRNVDLNLLKAFAELYDTANVTLAGERLGITQSSMSHALRRLRELFQDELFVKSTAGMAPTVLASELAGPITSTLKAFQQVLDAHSRFDPCTSTRQFRILMTDVVELMILPRLTKALAASAPHARLSIVQIPRSRYREALETGLADIALGQLPEAQVDFFQQQLFEEGFVCAMRKGHPLQGRLDIDSFLKASHLSIESPAVSEKLIKRGLGAKASRRNIVLRIPHYMVAPFVLAETDFIAVLPRPLMRAFAPHGQLAEEPLPFTTETVEFRQFWHRRTHLDPGCVWLRRQIATHFIR